MLFRTHISFGIFLVLLCFLIEPLISVWFGIAVLIGSLVPDIDSSYSFLGKNLIFRPIQFFIKHRGIMHSLFFGIFLFFIISYFSFVIGLGFLIGFLGHLILDLITKEGINLFWPVYFKIHGFFKTGGFIESLIFLILISVDFVLIIGAILIKIFS